jgi:predicted DCC family thiol-disulfide oxidoreductase YuxK
MSTPQIPTSTNPWITLFKEVCSVDLRSLALFRIGISLLIIIDLVQRSFDLKAHYTDLGVLPRWALTQGVGNRWHLSLHNISGMLEVEAVIFLLHGVIALLLLIGFKTKWMTIICWILIVSLHSRNPIILSGGDILLCVMLFWSMFLPLGARFSLDHALDSRRSDNRGANQYFSVASLAILIQLALVYTFNWIAKIHPTWMQDYTAVYYAMNLDMYATKFGTALLSFPLLMKAGTWLTLWLELLGPILLFSPIRNDVSRLLVILAFLGLHIGIALTLNIGYFPFVSIIVWTIAIPTVFWDKLWSVLFDRPGTYFRIYYDDDCDFCKKTVDILKVLLVWRNVTVQPAQDDPSIEPIFRENNSWVVVTSTGRTLIRFEAFIYALRQAPIVGYVAILLNVSPVVRVGTNMYQYVATNRGIFSKVTTHLKYRDNHSTLPKWAKISTVVILAYVIMWNIAVTEQINWKVPSLLYWPGPMFRIYQEWHMFAPYPALGDGWFVIPGTLRNGGTVDVYSRNPVDWSKPNDVSDTYVNNRWRKYLLTLYKPKFKDERLYYGKYICRSWNDPVVETDFDLMTFQIYFIEERTNPPGQSPDQQNRLLWRHNCYK